MTLMQSRRAGDERARVESPVPTRLSRRLGTADGVVVGLGAMLGAGVFAALAPAARAAGDAILVALAVAALVAYCNATSSAALAVRYPESGGAYAYGRHRLGPGWGFVAGWCFVTGKLASCAAMAMTFAAYALPAHARVLALAAVVAVTVLNYVGITRTVRATYAIVAVVLACLAFVVAAAIFGGAADFGRALPSDDARWGGVLEAAGFLFFAFAGYARIATLAEEMIDPARTIARAIPIALGLVLVLYASVTLAALAALGAPRLAQAQAPLAAVVEAGRFAAGTPVVRVGAAVASLGVLLSLLAGVSRTAFAMAANGDLPRGFGIVHPRHRVPGRAVVAAGAIVALTVLVADVRGAIGFSAFTVLLYYAIANAAALTLRDAAVGRLPLSAAAGLAGCALLASSLPVASIAGGGVVVALGCALYRFRWGRRT